jgi:hypothetical protein
MNFLKTLNFAVLCGAGLAALSASAHADTINVVDPMFDQFPAGVTKDTYLYFKSCGGTCEFADNYVVGWQSSGVFDTAHGILSGQWQIGDQTNRFNAGASPEPIVLRDINATISQVVSATAVAGVTYTLDVALGFSLGRNIYNGVPNNPDYANVYLMVGGKQSLVAVPLASDGLTEAMMQASGNFYDFETSYTATAADAGLPIEILLSSGPGSASNTAWFADVRLTDSLSSVDPLATPEPSTWAMLLLGFGGIAGVAAYRRSSGRRSAAGQLA